ncbi:MAG: hypothetical protein ACRDH8_10245 [Actinomycetota bacterium]
MRGKTWARGALVLAALTVLAAALLASPVGAKKKGVTKKKVKKIATKIVNQVAYTKGGADTRFLNVDEVITETASSGALLSTSSTTPVDLPGAQVALSTPGPSIITADFSGSSSCGGGAGANACLVRVLVDGAVAQPSENATGFYIWDSNDTASGNDVNESHSATFIASVGAGNHTVQVQWYANTGTSFGLRGWSLVAQSSPA